MIRFRATLQGWPSLHLFFVIVVKYFLIFYSPLFNYLIMFIFVFIYFAMSELIL